MSSVNNVEEAVGLLVQGADIGIKSGIFNIKEAKYLVDAIEFLIPNYFKTETPPPETKSEPPAESKKEYEL